MVNGGGLATEFRSDEEAVVFWLVATCYRVGLPYGPLAMEEVGWATVRVSFVDGGSNGGYRRW